MQRSTGWYTVHHKHLLMSPMSFVFTFSLGKEAYPRCKLHVHIIAVLCSSKCFVLMQCVISTLHINLNLVSYIGSKCNPRQVDRTSCTHSWQRCKLPFNHNLLCYVFSKSLCFPSSSCAISNASFSSLLLSIQGLQKWKTVALPTIKPALEKCTHTEKKVWRLLLKE